MPQEPLKSMKKNTGNTRDLPTVTVTSKLDPRLKAYQDSLNLYNKSNKLQQYLKEKNKKPYSELRNASYSLFDLMHDSYTLQKNKIKPVDKLTYGFEDVPGIDTKVLSVGKGVDDKLLINGKPASFGSVPIYKKPTQPFKYQKPQDIPIETIKKDIPSTPLSLMKKPKIVIQKQNNYDEGESIMLPIPSKLGGGGGAFIGTKKKDGTIEYVKPEDFKRMGVPPYGQEFILNQLAQEKK